MSIYGDFCAHNDDNDDTTDYFIPLAHVCRVHEISSHSTIPYQQVQFSQVCFADVCSLFIVQSCWFNFNCENHEIIIRRLENFLLYNIFDRYSLELTPRIRIQKCITL